MSVVNNVQSVLEESDILDVYSVHNGDSHISSPFSMDIGLTDFEGRQAKVEAMVDDGAMVAAMDIAVYERLRTTIGGWELTQRRFRIANGSVVPGTVRWKGRINVEGAEVDGDFEVFDSGGGWKFLFGKPLLEQFLAVHDYGKDTIKLQGSRGRWREVFNKKLGTALIAGPRDRLEESSQQEIPSSPTQGCAVLEEREEPLSGVTVKALTPLGREVENLNHDQQEQITNSPPQPTPQFEPKRPCRKPRVEDVPEGDPVATQGSSQDSIFTVDSEEWQTMERGWDDWVREERRLRREDTARLQEELERRREARRTAWEEGCGVERLAEAPTCGTGSSQVVLLEELLEGVTPTKEVEHHASGDHCDIDPTTGDSQNHPGMHRPAEMKSEEAGVMSDGAEGIPDGENIDVALERPRVDSVGGCEVPPSRGVSTNTLLVNPCNTDLGNVVPVQVLQAGHYANTDPLGPDFFPDALDQSNDVDLFTRNVGRKGAFRPERVREILHKVKIGPELSNDQRLRVERLLSEYADCFALSVGEVRPVKDAVHRLNIPEGATFPKKVRQKSLTPPQREYLHTKIDELLEAGVIERCNPEDVKCVSPLTLAQKVHEGKGLTVEQLMYKLNDECVAAGLPASFDLPTCPQPPDPTEHTDVAKPTKWRICQNFMAVNKLTEIVLMPQGNIRSKQQSLSGHNYICLFDFASGFYACEVERK
ncbi:MAG: hypothetical protein NXY57DRAFT_967998 [Lentinula lateritia]|nr:MAG: hypothetical protein NXY57DRAFT_967998 [Lentinula lateritia]